MLPLGELMKKIKKERRAEKITVAGFRRRFLFIRCSDCDNRMLRLKVQDKGGSKGPDYALCDVCGDYHPVFHFFA